MCGALTERVAVYLCSFFRFAVCPLPSRSVPSLSRVVPVPPVVFFFFIRATRFFRALFSIFLFFLLRTPHSSSTRTDRALFPPPRTIPSFFELARSELYSTLILRYEFFLVFFFRDCDLVWMTFFCFSWLFEHNDVFCALLLAPVRARPSLFALARVCASASRSVDLSSLFFSIFYFPSRRFLANFFFSCSV